MERGLDNKDYVIATTRKRLFQFVGKVAEGSEQQCFSSIFSQNPEQLPSFQEFPANMGYSEITFYTSKLRTLPKAFAWMMGNGVLYGQLDFVRPNSLLSDVQVSGCRSHLWVKSTSGDLFGSLNLCTHPLMHTGVGVHL